MPMFEEFGHAAMAVFVLLFLCVIVLVTHALSFALPLLSPQRFLLLFRFLQLFHENSPLSEVESAATVDRRPL